MSGSSDGLGGVSVRLLTENVREFGLDGAYVLAVCEGPGGLVSWHELIGFLRWEDRRLAEVFGWLAAGGCVVPDVFVGFSARDVKERLAVQFDKFFVGVGS